MSYCRWSSDDCQCDVYVYEDVGGGWTTHVAARRLVLDDTLPESIPVGRPGWAERYAERAEWFTKRAESDEHWVDVPPEHAGQTFHDPTPGECAKRLRALKAAGYVVPDYAIEALEQEEG